MDCHEFQYIHVTINQILPNGLFMRHTGFNTSMLLLIKGGDFDTFKILPCFNTSMLLLIVQMYVDQLVNLSFQYIHVTINPYSAI